MLNQSKIAQRAARILIGCLIGLLFGMWIFAILGAIATLLMVWGTTFWSMVQTLMLGLALVQSLQGLVCGAVVGSLMGAFKQTRTAFLLGELGGFLTFGIFFARGYLTTPWITLCAIAGILLTGVVLARIMRSISPTFANKQVSRLTQNARIGFLVLIALPLLLYIFHGMLVVGESYLNQAKWQQTGSRNYTISAELVGFPGIWGDVTIRNGQVVSAKTGDHPPLWSLEEYKALTIDTMFDTIRSYAFKPLFWEMVSYDPEYGYPKNVQFNNAYMLIPGVEGEVKIIVNEIKFE
ncbi:MAG: hypothetical protein HZB51_31490 [Chloroflexi bacterium]|nr:hypothetical protein [Chloroflexota bacterium]